MVEAIDQLVDTLEWAKVKGVKVNILSGAGVSVEGGIPDAQGVVKDIESEYGFFCEKARRKTYPELMKVLPPGFRQALFTRYNLNAKINMANLFLAQLCDKGYVDRVITTNFDSLFKRACTLLRKDIAVYDVADCREFRSFDIREPAAIYLHGQCDGFKQLNTNLECRSQREVLRQIFDQSGKNRVWVVIGYSGRTDPVFDHLASINRFDFGLYWVCYKDEDPPRHVRRRLMTDGKCAYELKGFTADSFFVTLAQRLNCFPPDFIRHPTPQTRSLLDRLAPYSGPFRNNGFKIDFKPFEQEQLAGPRKKVLKEDLDALTMLAGHYLLAKKYAEVIAMLSGYELSQASALRNILAIAYVMMGWLHYDEADKKAGEEAVRLKEKAEQMFYMAEDALPGMGDEALTSLFGLRGE